MKQAWHLNAVLGVSIFLPLEGEIIRQLIFCIPPIIARRRRARCRIAYFCVWQATSDNNLRAVKSSALLVCSRIGLSSVSL